ncbi:nicotinate-nucleotide--dimethylbenzimidazole phosphoribosyltransferase [Thermodesulfomicrobium sp. WS]|jgi:nicotinate-nucleotide--dimethylbenzimidazole phosphoribosyltransferase|uniref:nicotinate-nucleotide--dimethylbenzimidazole phosphoribosyltransferase n=1 Tax=Thermodesulfomicrobium sp. WS TaxID=3004129 RepID=UPI002490B46E|nr:nicotinate-nucleotide--dimethylbenzimidazole phosphoribosyltransferase [Thermodesulfomicrobium sp. WS]BDV00675.1 nicotinate-nucleotide--dimethylbenzimidazole phosphoribosyltransferase [Thermodesulfomicrobium sp. WS]
MSWTIPSVDPIDPHQITLAQQHLDNLTKPQGSLGRLETLAARLAAIHGGTPKVDPARIYTCAGDHGVAAHGVSLFPQAVTRQMVHNFLAGGAAINVLTREANVDLRVVDAGCAGGPFPEHPHLIQCKVASGTADFTQGPAMTRAQCEKALENGLELAKIAHAEGFVTVGTGEMGIGNTTPATALYCAYLGLAPEAITGPGTGLSPQRVQHKMAVIAAGLARHREVVAGGDPVAILAALGGLEIATLTGLILGAASRRMNVVVDGFIATAAFVAARAMAPTVQDYAFFAHASAEPGHRAVLAAVGDQGLIQLGLRLGEGTGAAMAVFILRCAAAIFTDMATFASAGVARATDEHQDGRG